MSATTAIWLGVVQGLTEFLPVSSSGHLVIAQHFMSDFEQPGLTFDVVLHLGTLGAVLLYLRREVGLVLSGWKPGDVGAPGRRLFALLVLGTIPAMVAALLFKDAIEASFENLSVVGVSLGVTGIWLLATSWFSRASAPSIVSSPKMHSSSACVRAPRSFPASLAPVGRSAPASPEDSRTAPPHGSRFCSPSPRFSAPRRST